MLSRFIATAALLLAIPAQAQDASHQQQARAILERLVAFRSAQSQGQVPATAAYIADYLRSAGVADADIITIPSGENVAMLVRIQGSDPSARPIMFSAHMDVVDARPEDWERSPFALVEEGGYFFGRGVEDNKTGVTGLVSSIVRMVRDGEQPRRTLVFAFVGDEETQQDSTVLIARHEWVRQAEYAINTDAGGGALSAEGRPLAYFVQVAEKSYASFRITARNPGGHSSVPRGDNAIYDLAAALLRIQAHVWPVEVNDLTRGFLAASGRVESGSIAGALTRFAADPGDAAALAEIRATPDYANMVATTCVATMLNAGHAENALPQRAEATVNCRIFPGAPRDGVQAELARLAGDGLSVELIGDFPQGQMSPLRADVAAAITASVQARTPGVPVAPSMSAGATDALIYTNAGIPTFGTSGVFAHGSEGFAHGLNEKIRVPSFYAAVDHVHDLALALSR